MAVSSEEASLILAIFRYHSGYRWWMGAHAIRSEFDGAMNRLIKNGKKIFCWP